MALYLVAFHLPKAHHHEHSEEGCCREHAHPDTHEGCCGDHSHSSELPNIFIKEITKLYPDHLFLFDGLCLVNSDESHQEIFRSLKKNIDSHSALWVLPVPQDSAGFLKPEILEWIQPRLYPPK